MCGAEAARFVEEPPAEPLAPTASRAATVGAQFQTVSAKLLLTRHAARISFPPPPATNEFESNLGFRRHFRLEAKKRTHSRTAHGGEEGAGDRMRAG